MPADKPESVTAELPGMGLPGQYVVRTVGPMFPLGDPRNRGGPAGLAGDYEVTFTFNRPGYPLQPEKSTVSGDQLEGDSHLGIPKEFWFNANVDGELFSFIGEPNSKNFLAKIVIKCSAKNIKDAHDRCFRALMPVLSNFALRWDVPLVLYQTDVKELRTGVLQITNRNPFSEVSNSGTIPDRPSCRPKAIWRDISRSDYDRECAVSVSMFFPVDRKHTRTANSYQPRCKSAPTAFDARGDLPAHGSRRD